MKKIHFFNIPDPNGVGSNPENILPYVFVTDDAFGFKCHMMKPYPYQNIPLDERILNCRCSGTRRIIENAFGIIEIRDQLLQIQKKVILITKSVAALHIFLMKNTQVKVKFPVIVHQLMLAKRVDLG